MISHITFGVTNLERSAQFYSPLMTLLEAEKYFESQKMVFWKFAKGESMFAITIPEDGQAATFGNGTMLALKVRSEELVGELYRTALELGGCCNGQPGPRDGGYFAAYFRDIDGNKTAVFYRPV